MTEPTEPDTIIPDNNAINNADIDSIDLSGIFSTVAVSSQDNISSEIQAIKERSIADGTFMKAPNGKPTNLTERQWLQVRTKAFKDWFGDWENDSANSSKIVDENGEPLVVYHGSPNKFTIFDINRFGDTDKGNQGKGFYFSSNYTSIMGYAKYEDKNVMPVFLNIRNPINGIMADSADLAMIGADSIEDAKNVVKDWIKQHKEEDPENYHPEMLDYYNELLDNINEERFIELKKYDGKMLGDKPYSSGEIVAINANQIKSATDNNGDFSSTNNDIRFSSLSVSNSTPSATAPSIRSFMANLYASTYDDIQEKLNNGVISITCK